MDKSILVAIGYLIHQFAIVFFFTASNDAGQLHASNNVCQKCTCFHVKPKLSKIKFQNIEFAFEPVVLIIFFVCKNSTILAYALRHLLKIKIQNVHLLQNI